LGGVIFKRREIGKGERGKRKVGGGGLVEGSNGNLRPLEEKKKTSRGIEGDENKR